MPRKKAPKSPLRGKPLSKRETEVLVLKSDGGHSSKTAAKVLGISLSSVDNTLYRAFRKLGAHNLQEAVRLAKASKLWPNGGNHSIVTVVPRRPGRVSAVVTLPVTDVWVAAKVAGRSVSDRFGPLVSAVVSRLRHHGVLAERGGTHMVTATGAALVATACAEYPEIMTEGIATEDAALWAEIGF